MNKQLALGTGNKVRKIHIILLQSCLLYKVIKGDQSTAVLSTATFNLSGIWHLAPGMESTALNEKPKLTYIHNMPEDSQVPHSGLHKSQHATQEAKQGSQLEMLSISLCIKFHLLQEFTQIPRLQGELDQYSQPKVLLTLTPNKLLICKYSADFTVMNSHGSRTVLGFVEYYV